MGNDDIKKKAREIRDKEQARTDRRAWELHKAEVIKAKAPELWKVLIAALMEGASAFNQEIGIDDYKITEIEALPNGLQLARRLQPIVILAAGVLPSLYGADSDHLQTTGSAR